MNRFDQQINTLHLTFIRNPWGPILLGILAFSWPTLPGYPAQAQSIAQSSSSDVNVQFIPPPTSSYDIDGLADRGAPDGREAAGTRGPCLPQTTDGMPFSSPSESLKLTALMPTVAVPYGNETVQTPMSTTTQAYPSFFFYMPHTHQKVKAMQFTLLDADDYPIASINVAVPQKAGLLRIDWPNDQPPLPIDTDYRWLLQVDCHNPTATYPSQPIAPQFATIFTTDLVVEGFIRRFAAANNGTLSHPHTTKVDVASQFAASGVWNDALHTLFSEPAIQSQSDTLSAALDQLLASVGLEDIAPYINES